MEDDLSQTIQSQNHLLFLEKLTSQWRQKTADEEKSPNTIPRGKRGRMKWLDIMVLQQYKNGLQAHFSGEVMTALSTRLKLTSVFLNTQ